MSPAIDDIEAPAIERPPEHPPLATTNPLLVNALREGKVDGAGRPFGELKDEEPTLRKPFTRAQLEAILAFGDEAE